MTEPAPRFEEPHVEDPAADATGADCAVFSRLFALHADGLRRYARRFVRTSDLAEDVVQEVFLDLWRRRTLVDVGGDIRGYLYVATRSRAINHVRRQRYEDMGKKRYEPPTWVNEGPVLSRGGADDDEVNRALEQVLAQMPPRRAEVVRIRLREGLSTAKIAERLGISPRTVETHILRGAALMRELLPKILGGDQSTP